MLFFCAHGSTKPCFRPLPKRPPEIKFGYCKKDANAPKTTSWWRGFAGPEELLASILICYITGRQLRNISILPRENDTLQSILGAIALGFAGNLWATICHECGHAVTYRICFGTWPESVTLGSSHPNDTPFLSALGGKLLFSGVNPFAGLTRFSPRIPFNDPKAIPVFAAGSMCGIAGYCALKKALCAYCPPPAAEQNISDDLFEEIVPQMASYAQLTVISEVINLAFDYDTPGSDSYNIAMVLENLRK